MAKVAPFHTDLQDHPASHRSVYHDHDDCPEGALLLPHHRKAGTGDRCAHFYKVEKWTRDNTIVDSLLYAGNKHPARTRLANPPSVI